MEGKRPRDVLTAAGNLGLLERELGAIEYRRLKLEERAAGGAPDAAALREEAARLLAQRVQVVQAIDAERARQGKPLA